MEGTSCGKKVVFLFLPISLVPSVTNLGKVVGGLDFFPDYCLYGGL